MLQVLRNRLKQGRASPYRSEASEAGLEDPVENQSRQVFVAADVKQVAVVEDIRAVEYIGAVASKKATEQVMWTLPRIEHARAVRSRGSDGELVCKLPDSTKTPTFLLDCYESAENGETLKRDSGHKDRAHCSDDG